MYGDKLFKNCIIFFVQTKEKCFCSPLIATENLARKIRHRFIDPIMSNDWDQQQLITVPVDASVCLRLYSSSAIGSNHRKQPPLNTPEKNNQFSIVSRYNCTFVTQFFKQIYNILSDSCHDGPEELFTYNWVLGFWWLFKAVHSSIPIVDNYTLFPKKLWPKTTCKVGVCVLNSRHHRYIFKKSFALHWSVSLASPLTLSHPRFLCVQLIHISIRSSSLQGLKDYMPPNNVLNS